MDKSLKKFIKADQSHPVASFESRGHFLGWETWMCFQAAERLWQVQYRRAEDQAKKGIKESKPLEKKQESGALIIKM